MADKDKSVILWVLAGVILLLLAVVVFIMPSQGPRETPLSFVLGGASPNNITNAVPSNVTQNGSCVVIEFYGAECPHCKNMIPIVSQVENETGVKFVGLEIWHNSTNQGIFQSYSDSIQKDCGMLGVPTFMSPKTNHSICGEMVESDLRYFVTSNCNVS